MKLLLVFLIVFTQLSNAHGNEELTTQAKIILDGMTLKEKISQLFIFNIYQNKFSKNYSNKLNTHRPGSFILFGKDIPSAKSLYSFTHQLTQNYVDATGLPPLIMIDQEGGHVTRVNTKPNLPSPLAVSMSGDASLSYQAGSQIAKILKLLGINMNLAPVVDLSDPYIRNFIGNRSFGNNPENVIKFASTQAFAFEEESIIPTFKHYPGHGGVTIDSHKKLPKKLSTLDELYSHDLKPFKSLIGKHPSASILIGHLAFPNIDPSGVPATFSKTLLTDVLKGQLKFKGLIITDDLQMHALKSYGSLIKRSKMAFDAGSDLLMITGSYNMQRKLINAFMRLVKKNKVSQGRVDESVLKVIKAKLIVKNSLPKKIKPFKKVLGQIKSHVKSLKVSTDTIINNNLKLAVNSIQPLINKDLQKSKSVKVFSAYKSFYKQLKNKFPDKNFKHHYLSRKRGLSSSSFANHDKSQLNIFYATGLGTIRMLKRLPSKTKKNTIVINSTHPGTLPNKNLFKNVINLNTPYSYSGKLLANIIRSNGEPLKSK